MKTLQEKVDELKENLAQQNALKKEERLLKTEITEMCEEELAKKDFGVVSVKAERNKIVFNTPKQVKWDQEKLKEVYNQIQNPEQYITIEYDVPESRFKAWPSDLQDIFVSARTVSKGSVSVKIEELKDGE